MSQKNRFKIHLTNFQEKFKLVNNVDSDKSSLFYFGDQSHQLFLQDARTPLFQLQALTRIEQKIGKESEISGKWQIEFKALEDAFGKYDFWHTLLQKNMDWESPEGILVFIRQQTERHLGHLESLLMHYGWICTSASSGIIPEERFSKDFKKYDWIKEEKETRKLTKFFRDEASSLHEKIVSGEIDLNHIEDGIHELRRKLRWLGIYSSALLGKVQHSNLDEHNVINHYITEENKSFKFNLLPEAQKDEETIRFLRGGFYALSKLIEGLGKIKDPGLITEEMVKIAQITGTNMNKLKI